MATSQQHQLSYAFVWTQISFNFLTAASPGLYLLPRLLVGGNGVQHPLKLQLQLPNSLCQFLFATLPNIRTDVEHKILVGDLIILASKHALFLDVHKVQQIAANQSNENAENWVKIDPPKPNIGQKRLACNPLPELRPPGSTHMLS